MPDFLNCIELCDLSLINDGLVWEGKNNTVHRFSDTDLK